MLQFIMPTYTKEFKIQVVNEYHETRDIEHILEKYNIARSTLFDWVSRYRKLTDKTEYTVDNYLKLKDQYERKCREVDIMERAHCFKDSPRQQKLEAVERLHGQFTIHEMCRVLGLDRGTFYNHIFRRVRETHYEKNRIIYREAIKRIFEESGKRFGITKIYHKMRIEGFKIDSKMVSFLFKEMELKSKHCKKRSFVKQEDVRYAYLKNKLNREFTQSEPNKFWVSDTTSIWVSKVRFYLCVIMDLFSRKIIAHRLASQDNFRLISNTFRDAFESRGRPERLIFHSDKGNGYVSNEFRALLHSLRVEQSCSKRGNPYDNAVIESFFSNMKRDELNSHNFEFFEEMQECVDDYMEFYNDYRPHRSLQNKNPNQIEKEFYHRKSD